MLWVQQNLSPFVLRKRKGKKKTDIVISWIKDTSPYLKLILTWIGLTFSPHLASLSKTKGMEWTHARDNIFKQYA